jgi:hypothetical protein
MKTRDEVEQLKRDWLRDPCYDLVNECGPPEGFEGYAGELAAFQSETRDRWERERLDRLKLIRRVGERPAFRDECTEGLTKLEYMATHIAAGLAARIGRTDDEVAAAAVAVAKALILELSKEKA